MASLAAVFIAHHTGYIWQPPSELERRMDALRVAMESHRFIVARLTTPFVWSPLSSPARKGSSRHDLPIRARIAALRVSELTANSHRPTDIRAFAAAQLALGEVEKAVVALREAALNNPTDADIWTDLSAAYYQQATVSHTALSIPKGLEAANIALELAPSNPIAWFNKALLLQQLNIRELAINAWQRFQQLEADTPWSREARLHVESLEQGSGATRRLDLQQPRDTLLDDVMPRWATAVIQRNEHGLAIGAEARTLLTTSGLSQDPMSSEVVDGFTRSDAEAARYAALGHVAYGAARALYKTNAFDAAAPEFATAEQMFFKAGSPARHLARLHQGILAYRLGQYREAVAILEGLRRNLNGGRYGFVEGRAAWAEATALEFLGRTHLAGQRYALAAPSLEDAGEYENAAYVRSLLAGQMDRLGNHNEAWTLWLRAFQQTARDGVLLSAAISATRLGWSRAALDLQAAATETARRANRPAGVADGLRWQAVSYAALGRPIDARARLDEARTVTGQQPGAAWDRIRAEIDLADAISEKSSEASNRIAAASRALEYFKSSGATARLPEIYLARAHASRSIGDFESARVDILEGHRLVVELGDHVAPGIDQIRYADVVRRLAVTLVELEDRRGRLADAFESVEDARGRDLASSSARLTLDDLRNGLPDRCVLVSFVVAEDRSFVWVVRRGSSTVLRIPSGRTAIEPLVRAAGSPRFDRVAGDQLRRLLFDPILNTVEAGTLLVIVGDGPLHSLPVAALPGVRSSHLIEEFPIVITPSARFWLATSLRAFHSQRPTRVFVAGEPRLDPTRYGELASLPAASEEAREVARLYGTVALLDSEVTRVAVLDGLKADVFHFAGHAIVNERDPGQSALVVWDPDGPGLSAQEIRSRARSLTRLVVLGACSTSSGSPTRSEGPISLARAFLASGAATVVASSWTVDDRASKELLLRFHAEYRQSGNPAAALRAAQIAMIRSSDPILRQPQHWAGFAVYGATPHPSGPTHLTRTH